MTQNLTLSHVASLFGPETLVVLDIDSSLVLTHKRNEVVLHEFARQFSTEFPEFCTRLAQVECKPMEYGYLSALKRAGLATDTPEAARLATFWRQHFFSNDYLHCDVVHAGALEFAQALTKIKQPHVYLTGRPRPSMWDGSLKTLQDFGFQVTSEILFLKPEPKMIDEDFKAEKMRELKKGYKHVVFIDNEPRVLNKIKEHHPEMVLVFVDTCHSPNVSPPESAVKIKDFRELNSLLQK